MNEEFSSEVLEFTFAANMFANMSVLPGLSVSATFLPRDVSDPLPFPYHLSPGR